MLYSAPEYFLYKWLNCCRSFFTSSFRPPHKRNIAAQRKRKCELEMKAQEHLQETNAVKTAYEELKHKKLLLYQLKKAYVMLHSKHWSKEHENFD